VTERPAATFFATPDDFRAWFEGNHEGAGELWVGFYKVGSGRASITWPQAVDQAYVRPDLHDGGLLAHQVRVAALPGRRYR